MSTRSLKCARSCGRGCTQAEYDAAVVAARRLAHRLGDWKWDVWENLGWHHRAISPCGRIKVHPSTGRAFMAFISPPGDIGGRWVGDGRTPRAAVRHALKTACDDLAPYMSLPRLTA